MRSFKIFLFTLCIFPIAWHVARAEEALPNPDTDPLLAAAANPNNLTAPAAHQAAAPVTGPATAPVPTDLADAYGSAPLPTPAASPVQRSIATPLPTRLAAPSTPLSIDTVLEQGKALYESGQYVAALDKFMQVLRRDPQQPEARQYLHTVVDQLRSKRGSAPARVQQDMTEGVPTAALEDEVRLRVRKRQLLTLDLAAVPGVHVNVDNTKGQVDIDTSLLFADKTGGLKEQGIPVLDRVAAWLKTFGQQPVYIHCYPEELQDSKLNGSLFLHRFAQLYGFFVDEQKLPAARFVNVGQSKPQEAPQRQTGPATLLPGSASQAPQPAESAVGDLSDTGVVVASGTPHIVITSVGGGALSTEEAPPAAVSGWLEFSITASHMSINPEEGEWTNLDLSAMTHKGVRAWYFKIVREGRKMPAAVSLEGKGNLLKRISWDGRDEKTGSFVSAGDYLCRLTATDSEGASLTKDLTLKVKRGNATSADMAEQPKQVVHYRAKRKPAHKTETTSAPLASSPVSAAQVNKMVSVPTPPTATAVSPVPVTVAKATPSEAAVPQSAPAPVPASAPAAPAVEPPAAAAAVAAPAQASDDSDTDSSVHAIWKQVIQFDTNDSDLKPTLKASLERIGKTLEVYPLQKVRVMGFADTSETNASTLARQRANMVRNTLINEYQVDAKRVIAAGGRVKTGSEGHSMSKVEISITN